MGESKVENKKKNSFFAVFFRQKYINRWGLMRNVTNENLSTHAAEVACIAHALAVIGNTYFGKSYDTDRVTVLALYHDMPEVFTGDLPTPVKYANEALRQCYAQVEAKAIEQLTDRLPAEMRDGYRSFVESFLALFPRNLLFLPILQCSR